MPGCDTGIITLRIICRYHSPAYNVICKGASLAYNGQVYMPVPKTGI